MWINDCGRNARVFGVEDHALSKYWYLAVSSSRVVNGIGTHYGKSYSSMAYDRSILIYLRHFFCHTWCCIRINKRVTDVFDILTGVRQAHILSSFFFRSTPPSRPNKSGLKCPSACPYIRLSVRPSIHKKLHHLSLTHVGATDILTLLIKASVTVTVNRGHRRALLPAQDYLPVHHVHRNH